MHLQTVTTATAAEVDAQVEPRPEPREQKERRGSHLFSGGLGLRAGSKRWGKPCRGFCCLAACCIQYMVTLRLASLPACGTMMPPWPFCPATLQA